jgi:hypothetical protein
VACVYKGVPLMTGLLQVDPCGPMYINIGDGGNREGLASNWTYPQPDWCVLLTGRFAPPQDRIASLKANVKNRF